MRATDYSREDYHRRAVLRVHEEFREGKPSNHCIDFYEKMNDLSGESDNDILFTEVDITGSSESTNSSDSTDCTDDSTEQVERTPDN